MSKVTSKLQVTLPKAIAEQLGIHPGDEIDWEITGEAVRVMPAGKRRQVKDGSQTRVGLFDQATRRQKKRESGVDPGLLRSATSGRGWAREDLYRRGNSRSGARKS